jgi:hypothetical protein
MCINQPYYTHNSKNRLEIFLSFNTRNELTGENVSWLSKGWREILHYAPFSKLLSLLSSPQALLLGRTPSLQVVQRKLLMAAEESKPLTVLICVCYIRSFTMVE